MSTRLLARTALLTALITVATLAIRIPSPATQGYINLGDTMVFTVALIFGGRTGGIAGGIGSALADGIGGYFHWAPWTLAIKGVEGFLVGTLASWVRRRYEGRLVRFFEVIILAFGGAWMVLGYYFAGTLLMGAVAALTEIPGNLLQATIGLIVAIPVTSVLRRTLK